MRQGHAASAADDDLVVVGIASDVLEQIVGGPQPAGAGGDIDQVVGDRHGTRVAWVEGGGVVLHSDVGRRCGQDVVLRYAQDDALRIVSVQVRVGHQAHGEHFVACQDGGRVEHVAHVVSDAVNDEPELRKGEMRAVPDPGFLETVEGCWVGEV